MVGACIGVKHTCGFTNNSLEENFYNGNTCSFPLMVRCGAELLYLDMLYVGKEPHVQGDISSLWYPWDLFAAATTAMCCYKLRALTKRSAQTRCILILPYSPQNEQFHHQRISMMSLGRGRVEVSGVWMHRRSSSLTRISKESCENPMSGNLGFGVFSDETSHLSNWWVMEILSWLLICSLSLNETLHLRSFHHSGKLTDHHGTYWPVWPCACPHVHQTHWWVVKWDLTDHWLSQLLSPVLFGNQTRMTSSPLTSSRSSGCVEAPSVLSVVPMHRGPTVWEAFRCLQCDPGQVAN